MNDELRNYDHSMNHDANQISAVHTMKTRSTYRYLAVAGRMETRLKHAGRPVRRGEMECADRLISVIATYIYIYVKIGAETL